VCYLLVKNSLVNDLERDNSLSEIRQHARHSITTHRSCVTISKVGIHLTPSQISDLFFSRNVHLLKVSFKLIYIYLSYESKKMLFYLNTDAVSDQHYCYRAKLGVILFVGFLYKILILQVTFRYKTVQ